MTVESTSEEALLGALRALDLALSRLRSAAAHTWGVSVADSLVMSTLAAGGAMTPGDLARSLQLSSGTMTTMLDRLEAAGHVHRVPHPDDRRSLHIELTASGQRAMRSLASSIGPALSAVSDRSALVDELLALAAALDRIGSAPSEGAQGADG